MYTIVAIGVGIIMIFMYIVTLYKACKGTSFPFIIVLTTLLLLSNVGLICTALFNDLASRLAN